MDFVLVSLEREISQAPFSCAEGMLIPKARSNPPLPPIFSSSPRMFTDPSTSLKGSLSLTLARGACKALGSHILSHYPAQNQARSWGSMWVSVTFLLPSVTGSSTSLPMVRVCFRSVGASCQHRLFTCWFLHGHPPVSTTLPSALGAWATTWCHSPPGESSASYCHDAQPPSTLTLPRFMMPALWFSAHDSLPLRNHLWSHPVCFLCSSRPVSSVCGDALLVFTWLMLHQSPPACFCSVSHQLSAPCSCSCYSARALRGMF